MEQGCQGFFRLLTLLAQIGSIIWPGVVRFSTKGEKLDMIVVPARVVELVENFSRDVDA